MKILTKYVVREFLKIVFISLTILITLYMVIHFFETIDEFIINKVEPGIILRYFIFKIPLIFFQMAPNAILLATVVCIGTLVRNNEVTAMRAAGISLLFISRPILLVSLSITLSLIVISEYVTPYTNEKHIYYREVKVRKGPHQRKFQENQIWYHSSDDTIWNIEYLNSKTNHFKGVHIYFFEKGEILIKRIDATAAIHDGKNWILKDVYVRNFDHQSKIKSEYFKSANYDFKEEPSDFYRIMRREEEMSIKHVYQYSKKLRKEGLNSTRYEVDFHYKISYPFICIVMALIGIPFSLRANSSGGIVFSFGITLVISGPYYFIYTFAVSLGHGEILPPWLAAWGINLIGLTFGFYLLLTLDSNVSFPLLHKWRHQKKLLQNNLNSN
jgi:lipopolysaccharide export system permease protein